MNRPLEVHLSSSAPPWHTQAPETVLAALASGEQGLALRLAKRPPPHGVFARARWVEECTPCARQGPHPKSPGPPRRLDTAGAVPASLPLRASHSKRKAGTMTRDALLRRPRTLILATLLLAAAAPAAAAVSAATEECLGCHEDVTPGIVGDWRASRHSKVTPAEGLAKPALERRISA
ncbi:MAG: hypothetical protein HY900_20360, partial [Deltaproteobacteria bacterium]|nr:hypothetical protein [Deltaproteobacteria bacterium]